MANRLEEQQQVCRIDIHEDMPHIFPLFRFHPSAMAALDRTSAFIREAVSISSSSSYTLDANSRNSGRNRSDSVVISIAPSSSRSSSASPSPSPSPPPRPRMGESDRDGSSTVLIDGVNEEGYLWDGNGARRVRRVSSSSSLSSAGSSSTPQQEQRQRKRQSAQHSKLEPQSVQSLDLDLAATDGELKTKKKRTSVNVIDLSGTSVMSYHKQTRFGTPSDRDRALLESEEAGLLDESGRRTRRRKKERLTLQDVVSDATLYEWEVLLQQGYIPTRHWPLPPSSGRLQKGTHRRRV